MLARPPSSSRERVSLTLDASLVKAAQAAGLDIGAIVEEALRVRIDQEAARRWVENNRDAIAQSNEELRRNGLWSDGLRLF